MRNDLRFVDSYLTQWDRFARGANELVPELRDTKEDFERALTRLLRSEDKRGPARMVFYAVVQVGGFIALDSALGKSVRELVGPEFPVFKQNRYRGFFAGDLYFWWRANRKTLKAFPLFERWRRRVFAKSVLIPMYESTCKQK